MNTLPTCLRFLCLTTALSLVVPVTAQDDDFHILVTNDDGIRSPGIQALAEALRSVGEVHVVAPCGQRSGASMSVALRDALTLQLVERDGYALGHCVDSTPAGAALLAITALAPEGGFDLVVSGINQGANIGAASHMSGTVGAANMGAFYRIPAIAASLGGGRDFDYPARFVASFVEEMKRRPPLPGIVLSINIPSSREEDVNGVTVAPMGGIELNFAYEEQPETAEGRVFRPQITINDGGFPPGSDTEAFARGMITITPIRFDWTAREALAELESWDLSHRTSGR